MELSLKEPKEKQKGIKNVKAQLFLLNKLFQGHEALLPFSLILRSFIPSHPH